MRSASGVVPEETTTAVVESIAKVSFGAIWIDAGSGTTAWVGCAAGGVTGVTGVVGLRPHAETKIARTSVLVRRLRLLSTIPYEGGQKAQTGRQPNAEGREMPNGARCQTTRNAKGRRAITSRPPERRTASKRRF